MSADTLKADIRCLQGGSIPMIVMSLYRWSVPVLTVTVHSSFFPTFDLFLNMLLSALFLLPYIIMDLPIFVIAEWTTLLVDIRCPRGRS